MVRSVHIIGLNEQGISACLLAGKNGFAVTASDLKNDPGFVEAVETKLPGYSLTFGQHPEAELEVAEYVVVSPGVVGNPDIWDQVTGRSNWISVVDFAFLVNRWTNRRVIVTGSYGKTTFCHLLGHLLASVGKGCLVAGNFEKPLTDVEVSSAEDVLILELDYQQLAATKLLKADAAVILNIHPEGNVFGCDERYSKTKLSPLGLLHPTGVAFVPAAVAKLAADLGMPRSRMAVPDQSLPMDASLIPASTVLLLAALWEFLDFSALSREVWMDLGNHMPRGRLNSRTVDDSLELINDGAAKGPVAVLSLQEKLKSRVNPILITNWQGIDAGRLQVVQPTDDGAEALETAVRRALDLASGHRSVIAYCPGIASVGAGWESILDRIDGFEDLVLKNHRPGS